MGYSISAATHDKLERNRHEGRLCRGTGRSCTTRARWRLTGEFWPVKIGKGKSAVNDDITLCNVHAREFPAGYEGVNFRVIRIESY